MYFLFTKIRGYSIIENTMDGYSYKSELEKNGALGFVPRGNSMWPTLKNKGQSVIVVKKQGRLDVFDVALYERADGQIVLHRVLEVTDDGYIMCGDSQFKKEHVSEEAVFGVMTGFYRNRKYIECSDKKYIDEVRRLYADEKRRKRRVRFFYMRLRIKNGLKKIFGPGEKSND